MPTTQEVLSVIGNRGVIVGSVARGKQDPKDLDIVIKQRGFEEKRNSVFTELISLYGEDCESSVPGHLVVSAKPLCVELFEDNGWQCDDKEKAKQQVSFQQAKRSTIRQMIFGISMLVQQN